ncbi:MAG: hypothetical protein JSU06_06680 [Actinobacteria bacterium]|nr:hypothetical protein [Actinomycetota bacterium]
MREKLNENPKAQVALVAVLLVAAAIFMLGKLGGGEEEVEGTEPVAVATSELVAGTPAALPAPGTGPGAVPAPPRRVVAAFNAGETVAILFVRNGGIDDRLAARSVRRLESFPDVATFVVPAKEVARYVSITQGLQLNRLPAFVVLRPKQLDKHVATASIQYGFQNPQSVAQAIVDARYHGGTLAYHP